MSYENETADSRLTLSENGVLLETIDDERSFTLSVGSGVIIANAFVANREYQASKITGTTDENGEITLDGSDGAEGESICDALNYANIYRSSLGVIVSVQGSDPIHAQGEINAVDDLVTGISFYFWDMAGNPVEEQEVSFVFQIISNIAN